jgi:cytochrome bd-type quinol oxidase subunit 2
VDLVLAGILYGKSSFLLVLLELIALPLIIHFKRKSAAEFEWLPSPAIFLGAIFIAALVGYAVGFSVSRGVACSGDEAGNLCWLTGFIVGPRIALIGALVAPVIVYVIGKKFQYVQDHHDKFSSVGDMNVRVAEAKESLKSHGYEVREGFFAPPMKVMGPNNFYQRMSPQKLIELAETVKQKE